MKEFLLVFRRDVQSETIQLSAEKMQAMTKPWQDWMGSLAAQNKLANSGNRLASEGKDLCLEAIRLCYLLVENKATNTPTVNALLSLMCFHASRFEARTDENGELILYDDQDTDLWNKELIEKGNYYLNASASGTKITRYHLEAGIAYWHTNKTDTAEKWESILQLYNQLLILEYSPIAALNRTYALSKTNGKETAILEAEKLNLDTNHLYFTLLGELYKGIDNSTSRAHFKTAYALAKTETDKQSIQKKMNGMDS